MASVVVGPQEQARRRGVRECLQQLPARNAYPASCLLFSHNPAPKLPKVFPTPAFLASPKMFGNSSYFRLRQPGPKDLFSKRRADVL